MNSLILQKLEELFNDLDNSSKIKEIVELKKKIKEDKNLERLLKEYRILDKHDSKIINIKEEIISNSLVKRYRKLENDLYFTVLEINRKLNTLIEKKGCNSESN